MDDITEHYIDNIAENYIENIDEYIDSMICELIVESIKRNKYFSLKQINTIIDKSFQNLSLEFKDETIRDHIIFLYTQYIEIKYNQLDIHYYKIWKNTLLYLKILDELYNHSDENEFINNEYTNCLEFIIKKN